MIQAGDQITFFTEPTHCSSQIVRANTTCSVPISVLLGSPFYLKVNQSVYAKVLATNAIGSSAYSNAGNGAVITMSYAPDSP